MIRLIIAFLLLSCVCEAQSNRGTFWQLNKSSSVSPQNLITYSEQFNNASWIKVGASGSTVTDDQTTAPDATTTADLLTAGTTEYGGVRRKAYDFLAIQYTGSVYLKKNNYDYVGLRIVGGISGTKYPFVNLSNNVINNQGVAGLSIGIEVLSGGWIRLWVTFTPAPGSSVFDVAIVASDGNHDISPAGTESVYVWGGQLNTGGIRTYTKTVATAIP